jgi:hypothetical protein
MLSFNIPGAAAYFFFKPWIMFKKAVSLNIFVRVEGMCIGIYVVNVKFFCGEPDPRITCMVIYEE